MAGDVKYPSLREPTLIRVDSIDLAVPVVAAYNRFRQFCPGQAELKAEKERENQAGTPQQLPLWCLLLMVWDREVA